MDLKEKLLSSFIAFENQYSTDNSYVNELRGEAITNFEKTGFPSKKNENWKYTSLKKIINQDFSLFLKLNVLLSIVMFNPILSTTLIAIK
jgi:Fe-S cluster assembly protein SufD